MTIKTIALALFSPAESGWLAKAGCELAAVLDAHVIGVHPSEPVMIYSDGMDPALLTDYLEWQRGDDASIGKYVAEAARRAGVAAEFRAQEGKLYGAESFLLSCLRGADLVVTGTAGAEGELPGTRRLREQAIRQSGRPVLVLPEKVPLATLPKRVLVGWSDSREAARAAHDALSLAAPGAAVDLLFVRHDAYMSEHAAGTREDFAAALDRRGFAATLLDRDAAAGNIGQALLTVAAERGADMVVTGAFGHSQLYDFIIGAVTSHLLERTGLPVLLSK